MTRAVVNEINAGAQIDNVVFDTLINGQLHADGRFVPASAMIAWFHKEMPDPLYFHYWVHVDNLFGEAPPPPAPIPSGNTLRCCLS